MTKTVAFTVPGEPTGKARPRVVRGHAFTPEKTVLYENLIKTEYERQCGRAIFEGPVGVTVIAYYSIPKSDSRKKRDLKINGALRPMKKPDADNVLKCICDALNGVAFVDDAQVVRPSLRNFTVWIQGSKSRSRRWNDEL